MGRWQRQGGGKEVAVVAVVASGRGGGFAGLHGVGLLRRAELGGRRLPEGGSVKPTWPVSLPDRLALPLPSYHAAAITNVCLPACLPLRPRTSCSRCTRCSC